MLAADHNLTAMAQQLKDAGCEGTMDTLRAQVYLVLLTGTPASALLPPRVGEPHPRNQPTGPGDRPSADSHSGAASEAGIGRGLGIGDGPGVSAPSGVPGAPPLAGLLGAPASPGIQGAPVHSGILPVKGSVNLTLPLATWLDLSHEPGHATGYGMVAAAQDHRCPAWRGALCATARPVDLVGVVPYRG